MGIAFPPKSSGTHLEGNLQFLCWCRFVSGFRKTMVIALFGRFSELWFSFEEDRKKTGFDPAGVFAWRA
jgi:hypothetical protein